MIRSYKFLGDVPQLKLHQMVLDFFNRIEFERGPFDEAFFGGSFGILANRHPKIVKDRCISIYNELRQWTTKERTEFFNAIRESNDIEGICRGNLLPKRITDEATGLFKTVRELFLDLYNQVLDGKPFKEIYRTSLSDHFIAFSKLNDDITLCPVCGIHELKKHTDDIRDQYDHYLPKSIYPFTSVNFWNLVPVCIECNSLEVKGSTDVIAVATNRKLFYLYDASHQELTVTFQLLNDDADANNLQWQINFHCPNGKVDEILSWKTIYHIDRRYRGLVNARIEKWYKHYWEYMQHNLVATLTDDVKQACYFGFLEGDEEQKLAFVRHPALNGFLANATLAQAAIQAKFYS